MKPVAIFRHSSTEGAGYFATYLERNSLPWKLIALDSGVAVPRDVRQFAGLAMMGGPMSVNDPLPWIAPVLELIREAVRKDVPVIGHCLGGQLMSKALGGSVGPNPVKEIGWGEVRIPDNEVAREWFGSRDPFLSFHWHGETFTIPPGATRIASSTHCANQAFVVGKHLGMQCHVEMTPEMIRTWYASGRDEIDAADSPAVQQPEDMEREIEQRVANLNQVAGRLYGKWVEGLAPE
ncbi:MAG: type 1 glutamine amidotransferase [Betaproteobacteria bacterium]